MLAVLKLKHNLMNLLLLTQYLGGSFVVVTRILNLFILILPLITCNYRIMKSNYGINFANACHSFDNSFNNICSPAEVIEKDHVVINEKLNTKDENLSIIEHFSENSSYDDNRYCVKLPFKQIKKVILDNFILPKNHLRYLKISLDKNHDILNTYNEIIKDYLTQNIVEKVPRLSEHKDPGTLHYLLHQAVIKKDRETTKLLMVFDAASKNKNDLSLNESLLNGPCLLPLLNDIFTRFRIAKYDLVSKHKARLSAKLFE